MSQPPAPCPACQGLRVTEHTRVEIELDEPGNPRPVLRQFTAQCGTCHGSGTAE